jgi:hypothetical protein
MKMLYLLLLTSSVAMADDAGLLRCRGIADPSARLACYDALVPAAAEAKPAQAEVKPAQAEVKPGQVEVKPAQAEVSPADRFGLERQGNKAEPDTIESSIPGRFDGWRPKAIIRLANGQLWQISDDSNGAYSFDNPKVKVRRGVFGAFYLEIEGANRSPRVIRLQ